jgi:hypothetical protein
MSKQLNDKHVVVVDDLQEYLRDESDFAFEMAILSDINRSTVHGEHGGLYVDPITKKTRQFDLRATVGTFRWQVHMAIECKNLKPHFPLLITAVPRRSEESVHSVLYFGDGLRCEAHVVSSTDLYGVDKPVGKNLAQVGRAKDTSITSTDEDVFAKWTQSINAASGLIAKALDYLKQPGDKSFIVPVVVVPDGRLWVATYDADGSLLKEPAQANHVPYFVKRTLWSELIANPNEYMISHVEFVTQTGLQSLLKFFSSPNGRECIFDG